MRERQLQQFGFAVVKKADCGGTRRTGISFAREKCEKLVILAMCSKTRRDVWEEDRFWRIGRPARELIQPRGIFGMRNGILSKRKAPGSLVMGIGPQTRWAGDLDSPRWVDPKLIVKAEGVGQQSWTSKRTFFAAHHTCATQTTQ